MNGLFHSIYGKNRSINIVHQLVLSTRITNFEFYISDMTLAHHLETTMKTSNKIAPLLIVLFLGIFSYPQLQAAINHGDTINLQEDPSKKQKRFTGFIIDASPADLLLYQQQTKIAEEIHAQFVPSSIDNKHDTGFTVVENSQLKNCCNPESNSPSTVMINKECLKTRPKSLK